MKSSCTNEKSADSRCTDNHVASDKMWHARQFFTKALRCLVLSAFKLQQPRKPSSSFTIKNPHNEFWLLHEMFTIDHLFLLLVTKSSWLVSCTDAISYHLKTDTRALTLTRGWIIHRCWTPTSLACPRYSLHFHWLGTSGAALAEICNRTLLMASSVSQHTHIITGSQ